MQTCTKLFWASTQTRSLRPTHFFTRLPLTQLQCSQRMSRARNVRAPWALQPKHAGGEHEQPKARLKKSSTAMKDYPVCGILAAPLSAPPEAVACGGGLCGLQKQSDYTVRILKIIRNVAHTRTHLHTYTPSQPDTRDSPHTFLLQISLVSRICFSFFILFVRVKLYRNFIGRCSQGNIRTPEIMEHMQQHLLILACKSLARV